MTPAAPFLNERQSLTCIHCGLCLGACPTYLETGNENESPRGRIYLMRAMQSGRLPIDDSTVRHIDLCLGCRACESACPSGVPYGALLEQTRDHIESTHPRGVYQSILRRWVIERIFPVPWRLRAALLPGRIARALRLDRFLPVSLRDSLSLVPTEMTSVRLPENSPAVGARKGAVGMISGCAMSAMFGRTNAATVRLLNVAGYDVITPPAQICCGALFAHSGRLDQAREHARANIRAFSRHSLDAIVINAAGCGSTLKEYGHLLDHEPAAQRFAQKVRDLTEFLIEQRFTEKKFRPWEGKVTYHDACHLAHPQHITRPPRDLVKAVARDQYVELPESDLCCGSAGTYNLTQPAMAAQLQERKVQNILATGATTLVTTNPGCILQIQAGLHNAAPGKVRVLHIADFLAEALE